MNQKKIIWIGGVIAYTLLVALICKHLFHEIDRGPASDGGWVEHERNMFTKTVVHNGIQCVLFAGQLHRGGISCDFKRLDP